MDCFGVVGSRTSVAQGLGRLFYALLRLVGGVERLCQWSGIEGVMYVGRTSVQKDEVMHARTQSVLPSSPSRNEVADAGHRLSQSQGARR